MQQWWPWLCLILAITVLALAGAWAWSWHQVQRLSKQLAGLEADQLIDPLLHLPNRRGLMTMSQPLLHAARRNGDALFCLVISVGGLSEIKQHHGQKVAEQVLISVGKMLRTQMRGTDVVGRGAPAKLCVVGPGTGSSLADIQRRLINALTLDPPLPQHGWQPQISVGSALLTPWEEGTIETLLARADDDCQIQQALPLPVRAPGEDDQAGVSSPPSRWSRGKGKTRT